MVIGGASDPTILVLLLLSMGCYNYNKTQVHILYHPASVMQSKAGHLIRQHCICMYIFCKLNYDE